MFSELDFPGKEINASYERFNEDRTKKIILVRHEGEKPYYSVSLEILNSNGGWTTLLALKRNPLDRRGFTFYLVGNAINDAGSSSNARFHYRAIDGKLVNYTSMSYVPIGYSVADDRRQLRRLGIFEQGDLMERIDFDRTAKRFFHQAIAGNFDQPKLIPYEPPLKFKDFPNLTFFPK